MIIAADVETYKKDVKEEYLPILDATGKYFIIGCIMKQSGAKKSFKNRKEMWDYVINLGEREFRNKRRLVVYMHNAKYDFYNIANLEEKGLRILSEDPFIAGFYKEIEKKLTGKQITNWIKYAKFNKIKYEIIADKLKTENKIVIRYRKEIIKFLDTLSIFNMSLEKLGQLIEIQKLEMPKNIGKKLTKEKLEELERYCFNDCRITLESVKYLRRKLEKDNMKIKNLCTINQIAINYVINELKKTKADGILIKNKKGENTEISIKQIHRTGWDHDKRQPIYENMFERIHSAYRGGYVRTWETGFIENVTDIDVNGLYPYSLINMKIPNLETERFIRKPLEMYKMDSLFNKIGISRVMIKNKDNELGLLLVRTNEKSYLPLKDKYIIGTYTHLELKKAIEEGYKIIDIEWSILYEETSNYFKEVYEKIYKKRKESGTNFDNWFYKMIMNASIGKLGQRKVNQEIFIDSIEKIQEYIENKIIVLRGIQNSTNMIYTKDPENKDMKKYYMPIIPCLVTAYARMYMYEQNKKIGAEDLIYQDTDSIIFKGDHLNKFKIGTELGEFKIEKDIKTGEPLVNVQAHIWGTKTKRIGNNLAVSGVWKKDLTVEEFESGKVKTIKMMGLKNNRNAEVGTFIEEERDLVIQEENFNKSKEIMDEQLIYIDNDIKDVSYFLNYINKIGNTFNISRSNTYKEK